MNFIQESFNHALMITGFVFIMMLVIEYLNVSTGGLWQNRIKGSRTKQYILAGLLGVTPGCLGAFAVVSLFSHRVISVGAVVTAMIATSGDESFVMFSVIPRTGLLVSCLLLLIGITAGVLTDLLIKEKPFPQQECRQVFKLHKKTTCESLPRRQILEQWRHCSPARGVLTVVLALFVFGLLGGQMGMKEWEWEKITILLGCLIAIFIVSTVPDHFLEQHLWEHVAKVHIPRIFFWTFGALLTMHFLVGHLHIEEWMRHNQLLMMVGAALVGLIPESGPHLLFLTLFTAKAVPLSVFLTSSIVQDGHGMLPLLAESRRDFFRIKGINFIVGLAVGVIGLMLNR